MVVVVGLVLFAHRSNWTLVAEENLTYGIMLRSTHCIEFY